MKYTLTRKFFVLLGKEFSITDEQGVLVGYAKQKAFKLREELTIFSDREMKTPLVSMKARNILDFGATYDVHDEISGQTLGSFRRMGARSLFRDEWRIYAPNSEEIGIIQEESKILAFVRRFMTNIIPQNYDLRIGAEDAGGFKQRFNLIKYVLDFEVNEQLLNKYLAFAAAVLLGAIEGRQE
ncbi:hypothetical protein CO112_03955 [Candidatus Dojkabacteria bacterium CG_4_9_14_3_um_filter_150_Dojkabacteria_WS6_41_13]|uniref:Uncharacterized protein n=1 Tax=Candidatus Dojkabacteria bacterium CG_4_10_14_0_2_um_filter_Dojkabacteria_WS6_41_15 TaxID=2014249 RepID=A0A2M7W186_9BACT|nr:MAG: hypothetical protein COZ14_04110 [Candidatus Dojkabacteria bacterium CG_4_10_14_3_um_filter_Dojkabacteria_WS6_41_9]PJA12855.1 MAG: hypothetical protein COX64_03980 [Candidatus Dojkabacteria bacterium CG_4_10_14_0_2_um_filter_Dojkabacteria_WS6_41_15]PJB22520.1 MAG: hypothetical protein CO112_03955 [Candidatus Dojkabacteria bacterium CG_4_9_14_3_um_filter_150_Dojkabacteria_WS6_41_13]